MFLDWKETSWYLCLSSAEEITRWENRFCGESCWESESHTELQRPGGKGRQMVAILASLQRAATTSPHHLMGVPSVFSLEKKKRMGWRTSHRSLSAFTTLYSELGSRGIHAYIHSTWKGFFSVILHKKDLTQVPFLIMWTCKMMSRLNSCEGQYVCSATSRICPLCFMLMQIVYDSFSLANMLKCHIAPLVLHQEHENYCSFKKVWKWFPFFFSC